MWNVYELRSHPRGWAIVHTRSGYVAEVWRSRKRAQEMLARFNQCA